MNTLTVRQRSILGNKLNRYLRANAKLMEAQQARDFEHKQVVDFIGTLPILFLQSEEYKKIIREL